ncbi:hemolysin activator HlyB [Agrobacterium albertimagni AOL15]|uniref:Hemolysin activator HlyB n=1 Tax=Agrobacterium albertimagni AOL15 TaxID=1156935 RepID=K2PWE7_9HYPH|nr:hemolysin activator HlyB [Agrobacterium albertimagni AOL15]
MEKATRPFALSCQSNESVGGLLKAVNGLFAERGFATTQAWLPEQDIAASKTLVIRVVPGRINTIVYKEERQPHKGFFPRMRELSGNVAKSTSLSEFVQRADAWLEGIDDDLERLTLLPPSARIALTSTIAKNDVLHVDRLQDTLDSLNRVPSNKAKAELMPGQRPATSDVQITNRVDDAFRLYGGYDTESIEGVDKLRFGITAEKDNLIGINDMWGLTLKSGIETNELSGNIAVPVGRATMRLKGDWSENMIDLGPLSELFMTTWNVSAGADWIVHSSRTERLVADFSVAHREQNRYINGVGLMDQRVSPLQAGLTYSRFFERASLSARIGASQGLSIFNARDDADDIDASTPHSQFTKLDASLSGSYVFPGHASVTSSLSTQWAATALYSDEQMTIGSRSSVRGYSNGSFKADQGAVWRNEVAFAMPVDWLLGKSGSSTQSDSQGPVQVSASPSEWARSSLSRLNPYLFLDAGLGRDIANEVTGYRVGSGVGLRYGGPRLSFDLGYAFRIAEDHRSQRVSEEKGELFMSMRLKVF